MKKNAPLVILIDDDQLIRKEIKTAWIDKAMVIAFTDPDSVFSFINRLREDEQFVIFIHQHGSGKYSLSRLRREYKFGDDGIAFITRGHADGNDKVEGVPIFNIDILGEGIPRGLNLVSKRKITRYKRNSDFNFYESEDRRIIGNIVDDLTLSKILGETIGKKAKGIKIKLVSPGLSGAVVMLANYEDESGISLSRLIKIDLEIDGLQAEYRNGKKIRKANLIKHNFIIADNKPQKIEDFYCVSYNVGASSTLRRYLISEFEGDQSAGEIIGTIERVLKGFEPFDQAFNGKEPLFAKGNIWRTKNKSYSGLNSKKHYNFGVIRSIKILQDNYSIADIKDRFGINDFGPVIEFCKESGGKFPVQIEDKTVATIDLFDREITNVPVAFIHGDFHAANILFDKDEDAFEYIDFPSIPPKRNEHALKDIVKLSTDIERYVVSNKKIKSGEIDIKQLMKGHEIFLMDPNLSGAGTLPAWVKRIYEIQFSLLEGAILRLNSFGISEDIARNHFHLVRLHYFLKCISYFSDIDEKVFFFVRASHDILKHLGRLKYGNKANEIF